MQRNNQKIFKTMNKTVKKILIGFGILVGIIAVAIGGFLYKFSSETSVMTPVNTGKISEHGYAIKDEFVNMYLLKDCLLYTSRCV